MTNRPAAEEAVDQTLALLLWAKDANGKDDVALFKGVLRRRDDGHFLELGKEPPLALLPSWMPMIRAANASIAEMVEGAPFVLSLRVRDAKEAHGLLRATGLSWPEEPS